MDLYHQIPPYPNALSGTTILVRLLDGLGFRLRWSTEGLSDEDYGFRPAPDCMSIEELVRHIWTLVNWMCLSSGVGGFKQGDHISITRRRVVEMIYALRGTLILMSDEDLKGVTIKGRPFWYILNGPISDAFTHVGQINSFRRLAGNSTPNANVFTGTPPDGS